MIFKTQISNLFDIVGEAHRLFLKPSSHREDGERLEAREFKTGKNYELINIFPKLFENPVFLNEIEKVCPKIS